MIRKIKNHEHTIINIWSIKKQDTSKIFSISYAELKPKNNNKDIRKLNHYSNAK